jgi:tetratricopeptide (TPR) repeat protein
VASGGGARRAPTSSCPRASRPPSAAASTTSRNPPPRTTEILRTAAILGKTFQFSELAAVAEQSEDQLLDALDEAVAAQLLETGAGEAVAFTHDKIREVLYLELNPIRRRRLHTRVAEGLEALRERGGRVAVEDLAHHFMEGGCLDKGFDYAMQAAADAATLYAYTDSLRIYEKARECAEALGRTDDLPKIDIAMGDVFYRKGEPLNAAAAYERALEAIGDPAEATPIKCKIGESLVLIGDARALTYLEEAKTTLDPETQPAEVARATMIEARFHHYHGRSGKAAELLLQAREPAERSGDIMLKAWIYGYLSGAYQHLADFEESNRWSRENIDLGEEQDNPAIESFGYEFMQENAFMHASWARSRSPPTAWPGTTSLSPTPTTVSETWPRRKPPATTVSSWPNASVTSAWPLSSPAGSP